MEHQYLWDMRKFRLGVTVKMRKIIQGNKWGMLNKRMKIRRQMRRSSRMQMVLMIHSPILIPHYSLPTQQHLQHHLHPILQHPRVCVPQLTHREILQQMCSPNSLQYPHMECLKLQHLPYPNIPCCMHCYICYWKSCNICGLATACNSPSHASCNTCVSKSCNTPFCTCCNTPSCMGSCTLHGISSISNNRVPVQHD